MSRAKIVKAAGLIQEGKPTPGWLQLMLYALKPKTFGERLQEFLTEAFGYLAVFACGFAFALMLNL